MKYEEMIKKIEEDLTKYKVKMIYSDSPYIDELHLDENAFRNVKNKAAFAITVDIRFNDYATVIHGDNIDYLILLPEECAAESKTNLNVLQAIQHELGHIKHNDLDIINFAMLFKDKAVAPNAVSVILRVFINKTIFLIKNPIAEYRADLEVSNKKEFIKLLEEAYCEAIPLYRTGLFSKYVRNIGYKYRLHKLRQAIKYESA